jgi:hypothetical protein
MNKLENALCALGLNMDFFDELKSEVETAKLITENGLLTTSKEDVDDELEQLDTSPDEDKINEDDENQIDMEIVSPLMREVYN